jgi:hypothetical protein
MTTARKLDFETTPSNGFSVVDTDGRRIAYAIGSDSNNEIRVMENFLSDNSVDKRNPN